ncbi:hypothetical protein ZIOFF_055878 [Zingiber officinale]|uniref:Uncharacterized protein n=1 Tax=Zingiber officinale TaxID=94328 RepID=A0A8J5KEZ8_ZINOF|nr:hypothetical protein ZIOFF_055878 [Zingiber officinale]
MPPAAGLLSASPHSPIIGRRTLRLFASQDHSKSDTMLVFTLVLLSGGPICTKPIREVMEFFLRSTAYKLWSRLFSSENGDMVDVVVPFIGEYITDGTLATFLKKPGDRVKVDEPISQMKLARLFENMIPGEEIYVEPFRRHFYTNGEGPAVKGRSGADLVEGLVIKDEDPTRS